jgi:antitoxin (DNA-binding transcriptional repressor) of toxin-antitoxin stability system
MALPREISERELRNASDDIMRGLDRGDSYIVTRNGVPVATLAPVGQRLFAKSADAIAAFQSAPPIDYQRFREDVDNLVDQGSEPGA